MMEELARLWAGLNPEVKSCLTVTLAGVLGGLANAALEREGLLLPRMGRGQVHLGFLGTVLVSVVAAHAVDHGFSTALVAAVCGAATLRRLKAGIDRDFERERRRAGGNKER